MKASPHPSKDTKHVLDMEQYFVMDSVGRKADVFWCPRIALRLGDLVVVVEIYFRFAGAGREETAAVQIDGAAHRDGEVQGIAAGAQQGAVSILST